METVVGIRVSQPVVILPHTHSQPTAQRHWARSGGIFVCYNQRLRVADDNWHLVGRDPGGWEPYYETQEASRYQEFSSPTVSRAEFEKRRYIVTP